jgi:hypothetical protein
VEKLLRMLAGMNTIKLKLKMEECERSCPLPIAMLKEFIEGIISVDDKAKSGEIKIGFDRNVVSENDIIRKIEQMRYEILDGK